MPSIQTAAGTRTADGNTVPLNVTLKDPTPPLNPLTFSPNRLICATCSKIPPTSGSKLTDKMWAAPAVRPVKLSKPVNAKGPAPISKVAPNSSAGPLGLGSNSN